MSPMRFFPFHICMFARSVSLTAKLTPQNLSYWEDSTRTVSFVVSICFKQCTFSENLANKPAFIIPLQWSYHLLRLKLSNVSPSVLDWAGVLAANILAADISSEKRTAFLWWRWYCSDDWYTTSFRWRLAGWIFDRGVRDPLKRSDIVSNVGSTTFWNTQRVRQIP